MRPLTPDFAAECPELGDAFAARRLSVSDEGIESECGVERLVTCWEGKCIADGFTDAPFDGNGGFCVAGNDVDSRPFGGTAPWAECVSPPLGCCKRFKCALKLSAPGSTVEACPRVEAAVEGDAPA